MASLSQRTTLFCKTKQWQTAAHGGPSQPYFVFTMKLHPARTFKGYQIARSSCSNITLEWSMVDFVSTNIIRARRLFTWPVKTSKLTDRSDWVSISKVSTRGTSVARRVSIVFKHLSRSAKLCSRVVNCLCIVSSRSIQRGSRVAKRWTTSSISSSRDSSDCTRVFTCWTV